MPAEALAEAGNSSLATAFVVYDSPMYDSGIFLILGLLGIALIVAPILAIAAFVRVRRLEQQRQQPPWPGADPALISRVYALEQKLAQLERRLASLGAEPAAPARAPEPRPAPPPPPPPRISPEMQAPPAATAGLPGISPQPAARPAPPDRISMENLIGGRGLMMLGGLLVLIATGFFLKYAFENNWIGPTGRVATGLLGGAGLLVASQQFLKRGYKYFSEVLAGLGAGVLYLSLYAGWNYYQLFPPAAAFFAMILVTAAMLALAVGRDSQRMAVVALVGGFLTPILSSTGQNAQVELFTYLLVLDAGLLVLARLREWRVLEPLAFAFTQIYFWGWYDRWYDPPQLASTFIFAALFFGVFAALPVIRSRAQGTMYQEQVAVVLANAGLFLLALRAMLWPDQRWTLTLVVLGLAALHLVVAQGLPRKPGEVPLVYFLYAGLALTFITLATPIRLEGRWLTIAWAVEGAVLMWTGFRTRMKFLRGAAFLMFAITVFRLFAFGVAAGTFLLNPRFGVFAVTVVCFVAALWFARQNADALEVTERQGFQVLGVAVNVLAVWALSAEAYDYFLPAPGLPIHRDAQLARQLALSLLWTVYAGALIVAGVRRRITGLRYQALVLFGLTIAKVFLIDMGFLSGIYRIVSSMVLGLVLLAVAFLYQKVMASQKTERE